MNGASNHVQGQFFRPRTWFIALALALCILFLRLPANESLLTRHTSIPHPQATQRPLRVASLDKPTATSRSDKPTLDIVVSMYTESLEQIRHMVKEVKELESLRDLSVTEYIYTKDPNADLQRMRDILNTSNIDILPNVGREAGTYFTHITNHWNDLARHTLFIQADPHDYEHAKNRITDYFTAQTGLLTLAYIDACTCTDCKELPRDPIRGWPRIAELYAAVNGRFCPEEVALTFMGQFIVSAKRIHSRSLETYRYLQTILEADSEHFIHKDPQNGTTVLKDEMDDPYFGHTLERTWMILWDCAEVSIFERCGGWEKLRSRRLPGEPDSQCQCLD